MIVKQLNMLHDICYYKAMSVIMLLYMQFVSAIIIYNFQLHIVHMRESEEDFGTAAQSHDGLAVLSVLFEVRILPNSYRLFRRKGLHVHNLQG